MSSKEFWEDDPDLFWAYRFSFYNSKKEQNEFMNYSAWLNGAYIHEAVSVALNNAFSKSKIKYREKPYELNKPNKALENEVIKIQNRVAEVRALFKQKEKNERKEEIVDNG